MARIRTIKPDAFKSESLSSVSVLARWTFAGLWTYVDDAGRGRADVRLIKAELYPLDDRTTAMDVDAAMNELIDSGCIHTFMSGGKVYIHIPEFLRHQKINRPTPATSPACSCEAHRLLTDHSIEPHHDGLSESSVSPQRGKGREGKGNGKGREARDSAATTRPPRTCPQHPNGTDTPCGKCADARKTADVWQKPTLSTKQTMCGDHPGRPALNCPDCAKEVMRVEPGHLKAIQKLAEGKTA